jgi:hypothetical protein
METMVKGLLQGFVGRAPLRKGHLCVADDMAKGMSKAEFRFVC